MNIIEQNLKESNPYFLFVYAIRSQVRRLLIEKSENVL